MEACWDKSLLKILLSMCRIVGNNASAMRAIFELLATAKAEDLRWRERRGFNWLLMLLI